MSGRRTSEPTKFDLIAREAMAELTPERQAAMTAREAADSAMRAAQDASARRQKWHDAVYAVTDHVSAEWALLHPNWQAVTRVHVERWLKQPKGQHLLLRGGPGTSKTVAAAWAVRHWVEPGENRGSVCWLYPDQVTDALLHWDEDKRPQLARHIVIDELGSELRPGFAVALDRLLERRRTRVLMTCNLSRKQFAGQYRDERLLDRFRGTTEIYDIPGTSRRPHIGDV